MPYITREDGERFVIPSYRDVLTVNQPSQLKKDILLLCQSYGEYITLQKKSPTQFEVAFSPEPGYLLGESIWHHFNKPIDMIYCEAIPNTTEAILVIVKAGSVYLDGSFPLDSIPEELIIFLTQQNNFEIYTHGDVPISQEPEAGKFSFEASSVKSFEQLSKPAFPTLPLLKAYQLQLVDPVLKEQGIGVFPAKPLIIVALLIVLGWAGWALLPSKQEVVVEVKEEVNPYQQYLDTLMSPAPMQEVEAALTEVKVLLQMPGWNVKEIKYIRGDITAKIYSNGGTVAGLYAWAKDNGATVDIQKDGMYLSMNVRTKSRPLPKNITSIDSIVGVMVDRLAKVYPGNNMTLGDTRNRGVFSQMEIKISFDKVSPALLSLIGKQLDDMPMTLQNITLSFDEDSNISGSFTLEALGS